MTLATQESSKKVVLASSNQGKLKEFESLFLNTNITIVPQSEFNVSDAEETGLTFIENAIIKARHACEQTGLPAIADDSGLAVDALNGAPGIYSARYAGRPGDTQACNQKLLVDMQHIAKNQKHQRSAKFHCVLVYLEHAKDPTPVISHGIWEGEILEQYEGSGGFGYDPLFYDPLLSKSAAQLSKAEKNQVSHRGKAMRELLAKLIK